MEMNLNRARDDWVVNRMIEAIDRPPDLTEGVGVSSQVSQLSDPIKLHPGLVVFD